ncbi:hypothetical protein SMICM17S_04080 [Streptomyces microflavus]
MDIPAELSTGERIRVLRESRGMSRPVLAQLCGRGVEWLKKIETGERELRSHNLLLQLAAALQVADLSVITGADPGGTAQPVQLGRLSNPVMPDIWAAVMTRTLTPPTGGPVDPAVLQGKVDQTWRLWHSSPRNRTEVGALLPALIRDGEHAVRVLDGDQRRAAYVALSDIYRLAGQATAYIAPAELAWVVADRALSAAQAADQPAAIAASAWNMGNILRETSYPEEALRVVMEASDLIRPHLEGAPEDWRGIYGALQLHAAVTAAREGNEGDAWRYWGKGDQVAKNLPPNYPVDRVRQGERRLPRGERGHDGRAAEPSAGRSTHNPYARPKAGGHWVRAGKKVKGRKRSSAGHPGPAAVHVVAANIQDRDGAKRSLLWTRLDHPGVRKFGRTRASPAASWSDTHDPRPRAGDRAQGPGPARIPGPAQEMGSRTHLLVAHCPPPPRA